MHLTAKLQYTLMHNYTFFDTDIRPAQEEKPLSNISTEVSHHLHMGNFHLANHFLYQYFSNNEIIHLPDWTIRSSLYYKNYLFNDNLLLSSGIDFRYSKAYFGNDYFPAFNTFYLQNRQEVGGYPVFDLFLNFRIQRFRGFIRIPHINKGLFGNDYFFVPEYPLYPRMFTIGVRWMFFD